MAAGFSGRSFQIQLAGITIAAVTTKSKTLTREPIDVTTDDSSGWRQLLATPGSRSVDVSIEGVATTANWQLIQDEWLGNVYSDITIVDSNGQTMTAADGFFLASAEFSGEQAGNVSFTAELQSSGVISIV